MTCPFQLTCAVGQGSAPVTVLLARFCCCCPRDCGSLGTSSGPRPHTWTGLLWVWRWQGPQGVHTISLKKKIISTLFLWSCSVLVTVLQKLIQSPPINKNTSLLPCGWEVSTSRWPSLTHYWRPGRVCQWNFVFICLFFYEGSCAEGRNWHWDFQKESHLPKFPSSLTVS